MGKLATVIAAPIKGALGTEIQVGDTVMVVTTGYSHNVSVNKGKYIGYIESKGSYYPKRARVEVEKERGFFVKPDGTKFDWHSEYNPDTWSQVRETLGRGTEKYIRKATLNLNRIASIKESDFGIVETVGKLV